jgi:hypothetical protein
MTTLPITAQQCVISLKAYLGTSPPNQLLSVFYLSADTQTGSIQNRQSIIVPASTTDQAVNLATIFPAALNPVIFQIVETTNVPTGFSFTTVSGSGRQIIGGVGLAAGFVCWMGTTTTTVYVSNTQGTEITLDIGVISN